MRFPEPPPLISKDFDYGQVLQTLSERGKFFEFLEIADNKYNHYEKWKYLARDWDIDPKSLWAAVKTSRLSNKTLKLSHILGFVFKVGTPSIVQQYLHKFDMHLGGSLQGETIIPSKEKDRYLISSLMEEAIASSQLEGAVTTRKVAKEMLENKRKPKNTSEQMIVNNYEAMKWIVANKNTPFSPEAIKLVHSILTKFTLTDRAEERTFRKSDDVKVVDVQTGAVVHTPPNASHLETLMNDFCIFANNQEKKNFFIHPITKGVILHFLIGYIHPFVDGNGRTARTIFYWYLLKKGYWLVQYMSISRIILNSKAQYARAYIHTEQDENDLTYFLIYNLEATEKALEDLKKYIHRKSVEKQNTIALLRNTNFNDRQIVLLQEVIQDLTLYFTVQQVQNKFRISNQTARNDLSGLVHAGAFAERKSGKLVQYLPVTSFVKKIANSKSTT